ncbi:PAS domain S-box protein [Desulfonatronum parangueonense]
MGTEQVLANILKTAPTGIGWVQNRTIVEVNDYILNLTGYSREELIGQNARMLYPAEEDFEFVGREKYRQIAETGTGSVETRFQTRDGAIRHVVLSSTPLDPDDLSIGVTFTVQDVTERKHSEEHFAKAFGASPAPLVISEIETGRFIDVNDRWVEMLGYTREEQIGRTSKEIGIWSDPDVRDRLIGKIKGQGFFKDEPIRFLNKSGENRFALWSAEVITLEGRDVLLSLLLDETDRRQAEAALASRSQKFLIALTGFIVVLLMLITWLFAILRQRNKGAAALRESEKKYRELFENAPVGVFQVTPEGRYLSLNPEYARTFGYATPGEMIDQKKTSATQLYARPEEREHYKDHLHRHGYARNYEVELKRGNGETVWVSMNTSVEKGPGGEIVYSGFLVDITERKQAEQVREKLQGQLLQAQKMESMGILAGGVAHDFNNLLQVMGGNIELLLHDKPSDHPDASRLRNVAKSIDRAAQLVRQLLLFGRKAESRRVRFDLNHEVQEAVRILERTTPKMIALELHLDPSAWPLLADPVQIEQIVLNLAGNAVDAMPDGGKLVMETSNALLDEAFTRLHPGAFAGRHVLLTVTDTGYGMDKEVMKHVFDPFFTTKDVGKGTGLGLASVYGIVKAHGGHIQCYSEPGLGTTFKIYLPAAEQEEGSMNEDTQETALQGGNETVLVVDDEPEIRELTREALQSFGYTVYSASNGEEALAFYQENSQSIDLILLDLNMPGMGGHQCLRELLQINPSAKVIIASGYSANGHGKDTLASGAVGFIGKPYQLKELAAGVRHALDNGETSST